MSKQSRKERRDRQASEIEESQRGLRESTSKTEELLNQSDKMLKRHQRECDDDVCRTVDPTAFAEAVYRHTGTMFYDIPTHSLVSIRIRLLLIGFLSCADNWKGRSRPPKIEFAVSARHVCGAFCAC
ncbi:MAG TPA: hypothetical protein VM913_06450 [Sphingomicrobium sp.]|jgi:hypothetical protein|nr:hypothetical protein [Sphingomicrobium sp.]